MAIFDIFKKKEKEKPAKVETGIKGLKKDEKVRPKPDTELPKEAKVKMKTKFSSPTKLPKEAKVKMKTKFSSPTKKAKVFGLAYRVLKNPHVTEKASDLIGRSQYIFKIFPRANKVEVKKAIEDVFKVNVLDVKIINVPKKKRRLGKIKGFRKGYKKAIIRIRKDQKIEVLSK